MKFLASITFDDGKKSHFTEYYPILKKFGYKGSFYPIVDQIGLSGRMTWKDLETLYKEGNEIGSHTYSHKSLYSLGEKEIEAELKNSKEALRKFNANTLSYPFGDYDERVKKIAEKYYLGARACGDIIGKEADLGINGKNPDRFSLKTLPIGELGFSGYKDKPFVWLIYAIHEPPRITLDYCFHSLQTRKVKMADGWNFFRNLFFEKMIRDKSENDLKKLCFFLKQKSIKIVTLKEGLSLLNA
jgi:peptidoglycan/xylan/chitin deacetylase (PgdA/CDA1 family)